MSSAPFDKLLDLLGPLGLPSGGAASLLQHLADVVDAPSAGVDVGAESVKHAEQRRRVRPVMIDREDRTRTRSAGRLRRGKVLDLVWARLRFMSAPAEVENLSLAPESSVSRYHPEGTKIVSPSS